MQWNANYPGGNENNDLTGDYAEADWQGGETGGYWASTHYDSDEARMMFFDATGVSGDWWATRTGGRSVRPVTD